MERGDPFVIPTAAAFRAPPRLYNPIARAISGAKHIDVTDLARLLAIINVAMADAGIAAWDSKYFYKLWRQVSGIRESDAGTASDPRFTPVGAPASNLPGPNFTPPLPAYPSGHATFGGALFQALRKFYHTDRIAFTFTSDEYNGQTRDRNGTVRPLVPRQFKTLSEAEEENGQSRIYLGIHFSFDKTEGITMGQRVTDYVMANAFLPVRGRR